MYGIVTYIWVMFMVNVGKHGVHGSYGIPRYFNLSNFLSCFWNCCCLGVEVASDGGKAYSTIECIDWTLASLHGRGERSVINSRFHLGVKQKTARRREIGHKMNLICLPVFLVCVTLFYHLAAQASKDTNFGPLNWKICTVYWIDELL